ncbi:MAG: hypothetical protein PQJ44_06530 [Sphaerochaetaceae bacterium]|nr:hypothetical protein [Sphaerochaetaceae bacterium]
MLNRAAILLRGKQPFVDWINSVEPDDKVKNVSLGDINKERTVYLIDEESAENLESMLQNNFKIFFENECFNWYIDESLWPQTFTLKMFHEWFDVELNSVVEDLVGTEIIDED